MRMKTSVIAVVLVVACTIDPPSSDGPISKSDVECTQTQF